MDTVQTVKSNVKLYMRRIKMKVVVKDSEGKIYIYHSINELITMLNAQFDLMNFELVEENEDE